MTNRHNVAHDEPGIMKIATWNVNHRATKKKIPPSMAAAIDALATDAIVLTEYVPSASSSAFVEQLEALGLRYHVVSKEVERQNHVLIASRTPLEAGEIFASAIAPSLPSNVLHVRLPQDGFEILGLRIPDYSLQPVIRRACWDWVDETMASILERPFVVLGDFNTATHYPKARCGDRLGKLQATGWQFASPTEGASHWTPKGHPVRIDHAFVSPHFVVRSTQYVAQVGECVLAGKRPGALSDHTALVVDVELIRDAGRLWAEPQ